MFYFNQTFHYGFDFLVMQLIISFSPGGNNDKTTTKSPKLRFIIFKILS